ILEAIGAYYSSVGEAMLKFLENRAVAAYVVRGDTVFFVRWESKAKRIPVTVDSLDKLLSLVERGFIDYIPCVHPLNENVPDRLVIDMDVGDKIKASEYWLDIVKHVAHATVKVLRRLKIETCVKFSGSRGFHIWFGLKKNRESNEMPVVSRDYFANARKFIARLTRLVEEELENTPEAVRVARKIIPEWKPIVTSQVAHKDLRKDQVLLDWSSMKRNGVARAPFSLHYKTALVSVPVDPDRIMEFSIEDAKPLYVVENLNKLKEAFELKYYSLDVLKTLNNYSFIEYAI
ncbi:MAG: hypothetical protein DRJ63_09055, partial [Thermoprotei archaeon]